MNYEETMFNKMRNDIDKSIIKMIQKENIEDIEKRFENELEIIMLNNNGWTVDKIICMSFLTRIKIIKNEL